MTTRLLPKTALATLAAVALLLPFGAPLPGSCLRTIGVAGAAPTPSASCGGDLRECLRQSADMRQTTFGGRYVTADDVARCMEAFRSCTSGGAGTGANPPASRSSESGSGKGLPQHFGIDTEHFAYDCLVSGNAVTCTATWKTATAEIDSFTHEVTGTLAGLTMTGTAVSNTKYHNSAGCSLEGNDTHPITFAFSSDGTVAVHSEPYVGTVDYTCPEGAGSNTYDAPALDLAGKWSEKN